MPNSLMNILEFEDRVEKAVAEFFEDYKTKSLMNVKEHPLDLSLVDWLDLLNDFLTVEAFRLHVPLTLVEMPAGVVSNKPEYPNNALFYYCPYCQKDKAHCNCEEY